MSNLAIPQLLLLSKNELSARKLLEYPFIICLFFKSKSIYLYWMLVQYLNSKLSCTIQIFFVIRTFGSYTYITIEFLYHNTYTKNITISLLQVFLILCKINNVNKHYPIVLNTYKNQRVPL